MTAPVNPFAQAAPAPPAPNPFGGNAAPSPFAQPGTFAAAASAAPGLDQEFGDASPPGNSDPKPRIRDMYLPGDGRLVLVTPKIVEVVPNNLQPGTTQKRLTVDFVPLDGGAFLWGGKPEKAPPVAHTFTMQPGELIEDMFISQQELVKSLIPFLPPARPSRLLARLVVGITKKQGNSPPWQFNSDKVTAQDRALASAWLAQARSATIGTTAPQ